MYKNRGFTLLELLVVVIIIGILVAIALPLYGRTIERGRMVEAITNLGAIRSSMLRYYTQWSKTTDDLDQLDWQDPATAGMGIQWFTSYTVDNWNDSTTPPKDLDYRCTRTSSQLPLGVGAYNVIMDGDTGTVSSPF